MRKNKSEAKGGRKLLVEPSLRREGQKKSNKGNVKKRRVTRLKFANTTYSDTKFEKKGGGDCKRTKSWCRKPRCWW